MVVANVDGGIDIGVTSHRLFSLLLDEIQNLVEASVADWQKMESGLPA